MQHIGQNFSEALHILLDAQGASKIAALLHAHPVVLSRWRTGKRSPRGPTRTAVQVLAHLHQHHPDVFEEVNEKLSL